MRILCPERSGPPSALKPRSILMWGLSYQTRDYTWAAAVKTPNPNYQATRKLTHFHCAKCFSNVPCVEPCSLGPQNVGTERCLKDGASPSADEEAEVREGQCLSQGHKARVGKLQSADDPRGSMGPVLAVG